MCLCWISSSVHPLDSIAGLLDLSLLYHLWISASFLLFTWHITLLLFRIFVTEVCVAIKDKMYTITKIAKLPKKVLLYFRSEISTFSLFISFFITFCSKCWFAFFWPEHIHRLKITTKLKIKVPADHGDHHRIAWTWPSSNNQIWLPICGCNWLKSRVLCCKDHICLPFNYLETLGGSVVIDLMCPSWRTCLDYIIHAEHPRILLEWSVKVTLEELDFKVICYFMYFLLPAGVQFSRAVIFYWGCPPVSS